MEGLAVKPLTVDFHEGGFLDKLNQESKLGFWSQLSDDEKKQAGSPWGPANPQALNRYSYVQNNPLKWTDPTGHNPAAAVLGGVLAGAGITVSAPAIAAIAAVLTIGAVAVFLSDAGNRDWLAQQIEGGITNVGSLADHVLTMGRKKEDVRWVDYLQRKYKLTAKQREELHEYITKKGYSREEIEQEAKDMAQENKAEEK